MRIVLIAGCVLTCCLAGGQETEEKVQSDVWKNAFSPFAFFVGDWEGESSGPAGKGKAGCQIQLDLKGKIVTIASQAEFPKTEDSPGEKRGDFGVVSLNKADNSVTLRQFHSEGFFNRYTLSVDDGGKKLVFTSNLIENFQPGWMARLTLTRTGDHSFDDALELKQPEGQWFRIAGSSYRRVRKKSGAP